jgi:hypothetical protein
MMMEKQKIIDIMSFTIRDSLRIEKICGFWVNNFVDLDICRHIIQMVFQKVV